MTDPITREQVERAIVAARVGTVYLSDFLGPGINWSLHAPDYVYRLWISPPRPPQAEHIAALTRWRDELVAAETPRAAEAERADKPAGVKIWPLPLDHAPEVVDVPQPIVKRCACPDVHDDVEAEWRPGEPYLTVTHTTIPLALLRAMLEAIDAQQGGAS